MVREYAIHFCVQNFIATCKLVGLPYPAEPDPCMRRKYLGRIRTVYDENYALAQHHGIPTSLLDWTENPLVAAFFASNPAAETNEICVWVYRDKEDPEEERACGLHHEQGRHNIYLRAQRGVMMTVCDQPEFFKTHGHWAALEDIHLDSKVVFLEKITLPAKEAAKLRELLFREGVSEAHLKPTYDNAAITSLSIL